MPIDDMPENPSPSSSAPFKGEAAKAPEESRGKKLVRQPHLSPEEVAKLRNRENVKEAAQAITADPNAEPAKSPSLGSVMHFDPRSSDILKVPVPGLEGDKRSNRRVIIRSDAEDLRQLLAEMGEAPAPPSSSSPPGPPPAVPKRRLPVDTFHQNIAKLEELHAQRQALREAMPQQEQRMQEREALLAVRVNDPNNPKMEEDLRLLTEAIDEFDGRWGKVNADFAVTRFELVKAAAGEEHLQNTLQATLSQFGEAAHRPLPRPPLPSSPMPAAPPSSLQSAPPAAAPMSEKAKKFLADLKDVGDLNTKIHELEARLTETNDKIASITVPVEQARKKVAEITAQKASSSELRAAKEALKGAEKTFKGQREALQKLTTDKQQISEELSRAGMDLMTTIKNLKLTATGSQAKALDDIIKGQMSPALYLVLTSPPEGAESPVQLEQFSSRLGAYREARTLLAQVENKLRTVESEVRAAQIGQGAVAKESEDPVKLIALRATVQQHLANREQDLIAFYERPEFASQRAGMHRAITEAAAAPIEDISLDRRESISVNTMQRTLNEIQDKTYIQVRDMTKAAAMFGSHSFQTLFPDDVQVIIRGYGKALKTAAAADKAFADDMRKKLDSSDPSQHAQIMTELFGPSNELLKHSMDAYKEVQSGATIIGELSKGVKTRDLQAWGEAAALEPWAQTLKEDVAAINAGAERGFYESLKEGRDGVRMLLQGGNPSDFKINSNMQKFRSVPVRTGEVELKDYLKMPLDAHQLTTKRASNMKDLFSGVVSEELKKSCPNDAEAKKTAFIRDDLSENDRKEGNKLTGESGSWRDVALKLAVLPQAEKEAKLALLRDPPANIVEFVLAPKPEVAVLNETRNHLIDFGNELNEITRRMS